MDYSTTRRCAKCGVEKPLTDFYNDQTKPLGKGYACKSCELARHKKPSRPRPVAPPEKACTKCRVVKPISAFCKSTRSATGYTSHCRECHSHYANPNGTYRPRTKKTPKPPRVKKVRLCPDDSKVCNRCGVTKPAYEFDRVKDGDGYHNQCKICRRAGAREWKRQNKEKIRQYEIENRDRLRELRREWVNKNRDRHLAMRRARDKTPKWRMYARLKQHARRVGKSSTVTLDEIQSLMERQKRCYYCKKCFSDKNKPTLDHVIPLAKGGQHVISNIVLACKACNCQKQARMIRLI